MPNQFHAKRPQTGPRLLVGIVALLPLAILAWFLVTPDMEPRATQRLQTTSPATKTPAIERVPISVQTTTPAPTEPYRGTLHPNEVFGNLECRMAAGHGTAAGSAVVMVPNDAGIKFSVVDGDGAVMGDTLPFRPNHYQLGQRTDGTPLVGLAALRLNSKHFRSPESPEPLRMYLGNNVIYESDKAWNFLVASDASSFAVHEPSGGGASHLLVHNLDLGTVRRFDLDTEMTPANAYESEYAITYSKDGSEVMFIPAHADAMGKGNYWFYPVGEGRTRHITVEHGLSALLVSSTEGYFVDPVKDLPPEKRASVWQITKRRLYPGEGRTEDLWQRTVDLAWFAGTLTISDDGRWLGVDGWNFSVLNTENGEVAFQYPTANQSERQLAMLSSILGENASTADLGRIGHIAFRHGLLLFYREFGSRDRACATPPGEEYDDLRNRQCLRDLRERGLFKTVYDAYDLETLAPGAQPMYREEIYPEAPCMEGDLPFRGLQSVKGRLTYLTRAR